MLSSHSHVVEAKYLPIESPASYAGNPLIEALPPIFSADIVIEKLGNFPRIAFAKERSLPKHIRGHCVSAIEDLVVPTPMAYEVEPAISIMLRRGYAARSPYDELWRKRLFSIQAEMSKPLDVYAVRSKTVPVMMVTSVTGGGKTTLVEGLLEMYPQVIVHTEFRGQPFNVRQLVWIRVNASFDASLKGLMLSLFGAVDEALKTDYRKQYESSKHSIDTMVGRWAQVVATHHLGLLFIDEIQCLLLRGDEEAKLALSLFLKIGNVCRLPMIVGGTYSAVKLFSRVARNARRVCSGGYFDLELPRAFDDRFWNEGIVEVVWRYQWVAKPAELNVSLRKAIFSLSQGVVAILIALHRAAQVYAIRNDLETVDATVLGKVYRTQFVLLHPAIEALKSKKANRLSKFEDLLPPKDQLEAMMAPTASELRDESLARLLALNGASMSQIAGSSNADNVTTTKFATDSSKKPKCDALALKKEAARQLLLEKLIADPEFSKLALQLPTEGAG